jgi:hypothetical protein
MSRIAARTNRPPGRSATISPGAPGPGNATQLDRASRFEGAAGAVDEPPAPRLAHDAFSPPVGAAPF